MKRTSMGFMAAAWIFFAAAPGFTTEPIGPLKSLKIGVDKVMQTRQSSAGFQFANFTVSPGHGGDSQSWNVELSITQPISENSWLVKTVFQDRAGADLFSGEDILLPAGHAGKVYRLTRSFQVDPRSFTVIFRVYNRAEDRIIATQAYPVRATPSVPGKVSDSVVMIDTSLDVAFIPDPEDRSRFRIQNNSALTVKIDESFATARFLAGADRKIRCKCDPDHIMPGKSSSCQWDSSVYGCPTLTAVDCTIQLNGITHYHQIQFDAPIEWIPTNKPLVRLEKSDKLVGWREGAMGTASIIIRGGYVRIGTLVTMKALASVDSDLFPVVFPGVQEDDGIHAEITIMGKRYGKPDRFCFNLMEITTCDELHCGGVGLLLYRNIYRADMSGVNVFLENQACK